MSDEESGMQKARRHNPCQVAALPLPTNPAAGSVGLSVYVFVWWWDWLVAWGVDSQMVGLGGLTLHHFKSDG